MTDITTTLTYTADLTRPLRRMNIPALFITDARRAHRITVTVLRAGNPVDLGDTAVSGTVKHLRTGTTIPLSGSAQGSIASVTLPPAAYAQPGDIEIYVTLTSGDVQNCIFAATGCVFPSSTDRVADVPGFYSLAALQEQFSSLDARLRALEEIGIPVTTADQLVSAVTLDSWKFNLISATANTGYSSTVEAEAGFDDASWRTVSVPHDWSVELDFNSSSPATYEGGYLDGGDAWYRTTVSVNKQSGRRYVLCFDGVYMESTVYVNGQQVHKNYYGYNPFAVDATEQMVSGVNTIAVFVRNEQPSSRWYSGSGMIRPVELVTLLDDQIRMENIRVTTPKLDSDLTNGETVITFDAVNKTGGGSIGDVHGGFVRPGRRESRHGRCVGGDCGRRNAERQRDGSVPQPEAMAHQRRAAAGFDGKRKKRVGIGQSADVRERAGGETAWRTACLGQKHAGRRADPDRARADCQRW